MRRPLPTGLIVLLSAAGAVLLFLLLAPLFQKDNKAEQAQQPVNSGSNVSSSGIPAFVPAANAATPAVVHIKTLYNSPAEANPLAELYGLPPGAYRQQAGSGSGICISEDGYVATNNHVIENAARIEVIFPDKRVFEGKLVGRDPSTDLALIKVDGRKLPTLRMGNSDNVRIGEWVLAIGYPFSLNTTVTAGIVSAKGRSIGILDQPRNPSSFSADEQAPSPIESFIQTDAAINPGNSGGALINTNGELVGINAAIASQTGSYAGYGFAIPVNLARKILDDLKEFGEVRRGYLGVTFPAPLTEDQFFRQQGIDPSRIKGVLITGVQRGSAADEAGLQAGDVIQQIDGVNISSSAEFSERIGRHRPNDEVKLTYLRKGKTGTVTVKLKGEVSMTQEGANLQSLEEIYNKLGAAFAPLTSEQKEYYRLNSGIVVTEVRRGGLFHQVDIPPGTIIVRINGQAVNAPQDIDAVLSSAGSSRIRIDGIAPDGSRIMFTFSLGA